jgi:hypothetical protein
MWKMLKRLIQAVLYLHVPRAEDLPYWGSPPIQYVYESTAILDAGFYTWADVPSALTPNRPVLANVLYFFRNFSMAADIEELDFTSAIVTTPQFNAHLKSDARAPLFREPLLMNKFFNLLPYRLWWATQQGGDNSDRQTGDQLLGTWTGTLIQTPALIGKTAITLKAIITAQEVSDEYFVNQFRTNPYPRLPTVIDSMDTDLCESEVG